EVLHVPVRAAGIDGAQPFREVADVVEMLLHPLAQQAAVELARGPGLAPRMDGGMALLDRFLEGQTECTLGHGEPPHRFRTGYCIQSGRNMSISGPAPHRYALSRERIQMKTEDYTEGDAFQAEKRTVFSTEWLPLCAEGQLGKPGDFVAA